MRNPRYRRQGFKLAALMAANAAACAISCVVFPYFVGHVDPTCSIVHTSWDAVEEAASPDGTRAYAEITPPRLGFPGAMEIGVTNETERPMYNVTVRYPLDRPIVEVAHRPDPRITVTRDAVEATFDIVDPNIESHRAIDFRYAVDARH